MSWSRLIRFVDVAGREKLGDACVSDDLDLATKLDANDLWATELQCSSITGPFTRGEKVQVKSLKPTLSPSDVPIIRCIGLNYMKHSEFRHDFPTLQPANKI